MLGIWGTSAYKEMTDFCSHKEYLEYMYGQADGFITRSVIPQDKSGFYLETFARSKRLIHKNSYFGKENVYTSMNTFLCARKKDNEDSGRKVVNLKQLNALYIDIDCYKIGLTKEQVLLELEQDYFNSKIPVPTFVIDSGRGLYLIWKIKEDRNALPRWSKVENYLFEQCKEFNADPQALDAARILRVPFTVNGKSKSSVKIMQFNDVRYSLYEIMREYNIKGKTCKQATNVYGKATARQRSIAQWQASRFGVALPNFDSYDETFTFIGEHSKSSFTEGESTITNVSIFAEAKSIVHMLDGRISDLFKLFSLRVGENCCREYALFLCRLWVGERSNNFEYALSEAKRLNASFDVPFSDKYVEVATKSAETKLKRGSTYKYSTNTVVRNLSITPEEQLSLDYLCSYNKDAKARRKNDNRRAYLLRLNKQNKSSKADLLLTRRNSIANLLAQGKSKEEICSMLAISPRTFDRDKSYVVAEGLLDVALEALKAMREKATETVEKVVKTAKTVVVSAEKCISPFFQYTNYKRTPVGCTACDVGQGSDSVSYVQLSFWDFDFWESG